MISIVVIIFVCLAVCAFILTAISAFTHFTRTSFGRMFVVCMAASIFGTLFVLMFLPGQRPVATRFGHMVDRMVGFIDVDRTHLAHSDAKRMNAIARSEANGSEANSAATLAEVDTDYEQAIEESVVTQIDRSIASADRAPLAPESPPPMSAPALEAHRSAAGPSGSRLVPFAVSASLLAAFLFVGYLFLDSGTRGHFTWGLRITMLVAFLAASAMFIIWK